MRFALPAPGREHRELIPATAISIKDKNQKNSEGKAGGVEGEPALGSPCSLDLVSVQVLLSSAAVQEMSRLLSLF